MKKTAFLTLCVALTLAAKAQTPCDTIRHSALPYLQTFEGLTDSSLFASGCWQRGAVDLVFFLEHGGNAFADLVCDDSNSCRLRLATNHNQWAATVAMPPVDNLSDLEVSFNTYQEVENFNPWTSTWGYIKVGVLEDSNDLSSFVPLGAIASSSSWTRGRVRLASYHGSGKILAFMGCKGNISSPLPAGDSNYVFLYVDSIELRQITTCGSVDRLRATNIIDTQATITWRDPEWAGNFKVIVSGVGYDTILTTTDTSVTLTSLLPNSNYTVLVCVLCAAGEGPVASTSFSTTHPVGPTPIAPSGSTSVTLTPEIVGKTLTQRVFIPDGQECLGYNLDHIEIPLTLTEFRAEDTIRTGSDVRSVCVNIEHSYSADVNLAVICPTGQMVILKNGAHGFGPEHGMDITGHGGNAFLGLPLDDEPWEDTDNKCDSLSNPFGVGLDYCFSRCAGYTLVTGDDASAVWTEQMPLPVGDFYITSSPMGNNYAIYTDTMVASYSTIPSYFLNHPGVTPPDDTLIHVKRPSNHAAQSDYYLPVDPFDALVGCPMNGQWKLYVKDGWGHDNGWVFGWSVDLRNVYNSDPDTVIVHDTVVVHDTVFVTVGIENAESIDVKIYAANGQIVVEGKGTLPTVRVYDISGREIAAPSQTDNSGERQLFTVPSTGAYMVKVGDNPARKVVVVR